MVARFFFRLAVGVTGFVASSTPAMAHARGVAEPPVASVEQFVQVCTTHLDLTAAQRLSLRTYLEQEIEYMASQAANHSPAEVADLVPIERAQFQLVTGRLLSPDQLRQFHELEATPKMREFLRHMALAS